MYRKDNILWPEGEPPSDAYCDEDRRLAILTAHGTEGMLDDPELQEVVDLAVDGSCLNHCAFSACPLTLNRTPLGLPWVDTSS